MWEVMAIDTEIRTVYVALLGEGTDVWRPVEAIEIGANRFALLRPHDYDESSESWQYLPGTVVRCEEQEKDGEHLLVAVEQLVV